MKVVWSVTLKLDPEPNILAQGVYGPIGFGSLWAFIQKPEHKLKQKKKKKPSSFTKKY